MKALRMLTRSIRDAFKSVVRNFSLSLASISCITITLIIVALAIIASFNVDNFTKEIEKDMTIVVFMDNESTDDDIKDAETRIKKLSNVEKYTYQSKVDVKEQMQSESDVFKAVLDEWDEDESPLKDTLQIKVKDVTKIKDTANSYLPFYVNMNKYVLSECVLVSNSLHCFLRLWGSSS